MNFDGITYAKGASVLKQLVAWVGLDNFLDRAPGYFKDFAFGNSEFTDLLAALEKASGRELDSWAQEWLQTSGVNTLAPEFELDADGSYAVLRGAPDAPTPTIPTLRRHRLGIGLYDERDGHLVRRTYVRDRRRGRADRGPASWSARSSPTCCCSTTATSPTPRSGSTSGRWPPWSTASARSTTRWPGHCAGARPGT